MCDINESLSTHDVLYHVRLPQETRGKTAVVVRKIPELQVNLPYNDRPVSIVPLYHPAARPRNRTLKGQEVDYQRLRMILDSC